MYSPILPSRAAGRALAAVLLFVGGAGAAHAAHDVLERDPDFGGDRSGCSGVSRPGDCGIPFDAPGSDGVDTGVSVLRTADGSRYVVVAETSVAEPPTESGLGLSRRLRDGSIDAAYGSGGRTLVQLGLFDVFGAVIDAQDRVYVGGRIRGPFTEPGVRNDEDLVVARFDATGALDMAFGDDGTTVISCGTHDELMTALAVDGEGRVLVAGSYFDSYGVAARGSCLVTLVDDGTLLPASMRDYPMQADSTSGVHTIDTTTPETRYVRRNYCATPGCTAAPIITVHVWDAPDASPPLHGPFTVATPTDGACIPAAHLGLRGPMLMLDRDGGFGFQQLVQANVGLTPGGNPHIATAILSRRPEDAPGVLQLSCLAGPTLPPQFEAYHMAALAPGGDVVISGQFHPDTSGEQPAIGATVARLRPDGRYALEARPGQGALRQFTVPTASGPHLWTYASASVGALLVDPGIDDAPQAARQVLLLGSHQYAADAPDMDGVLLRLGADVTIFSDDF